MHLEAVRLDTGKSIDLASLPAAWFREEYDRHAHFESPPGSQAHKLAKALLEQGLAVEEPEARWEYRHESSVPWPHIALGCEFHFDGWKRKESEDNPPMKLNGYFIRY